MNKTINVNIGGLPFIIDEDAHLMLSSYLSQIENRLTPLEKREIMEDVENRIAGIFSDGVGVRQQVINIAMVRNAIAILGNADAFGDMQNQPTPPPPLRFERRERRQIPGSMGFFRNRNDKIIAGICGGLAPVWGIDATLLRLIILVAFFVSFSILFWVYIVLWIIVPFGDSVHTNTNRNERR